MDREQINKEFGISVHHLPKQSHRHIEFRNMLLKHILPIDQFCQFKQVNSALFNIHSPCFDKQLTCEYIKWKRRYSLFELSEIETILTISDALNGIETNDQSKSNQWKHDKQRIIKSAEEL
eukprot:171400_1